MAKLTTSQLKKQAKKINDAKDSIRELLSLHEDGYITYNEYCQRRYKYLKILGSDSFYREDGKLKVEFD